jgi:putative transposase
VCLPQTASRLGFLRLHERSYSLGSMPYVILRTLISALQTQQGLAIENLALRHQLNVLQRTARKPRLRAADRLLWVLLLRFWKGWRESLTIVRPETVIRWHREGFRL